VKGRDPTAVNGPESVYRIETECYFSSGTGPVAGTAVNGSESLQVG
jgi:hypothetical protein